MCSLWQIQCMTQTVFARGEFWALFVVSHNASCMWQEYVSTFEVHIYLFIYFLLVSSAGDILGKKKTVHAKAEMDGDIQPGEGSRET